MCRTTEGQKEVTEVTVLEPEARRRGPLESYRSEKGDRERGAPNYYIGTSIFLEYACHVSPRRTQGSPL